jgi:Protein of unknown function (DUF4038)
MQLPWDAHGPLQVSPNHRYLTHADGTPFFWIGDTAWELFHRLTREEVTHYLETRSAQGFNVFQAVALSELDGLRTPNAYGHRPLIDFDPTKPDPSGYWDHVDWVVDEAARFGIYVGLLPTWGDKVHPLWGDGPQIFNPENAFAYANWLAERYANRPNIIWINGGDRPVIGNESVWDAIAHGLRAGDSQRRLISFHPVGEQTSSEDLHDRDWLDFNMMQTGHGPLDQAKIVRMSRSCYDRTPVKPFIDAEPAYENHPIGFNPLNGYFNERMVRQAMFASIFSGGCGVTYGCHAIWQFAADAQKPINNPISHWRYSLTLPAANQISALRDLAQRLAPWELSPATTVLKDNSRHLALANEDRFAVYLANGPTLGLAHSVKDRIKSADWLNPRTGQAETASAPFDAPTAEDWIFHAQLQTD